MLRRLLIGLVLGSIIGGVMAVALVAWLKVTLFAGPLEAYPAALAAGVLAGLVSGKPVWKAGAKVEAALKALFGALAGAAGMFALRRWGAGWTLDLRAIGAGGPAPLGDLPAASLPILGAALAVLFEVDNTESEKTTNLATEPAPRSAAPTGRSVSPRGRTAPAAGKSHRVDDDERPDEDATKQTKR